MPTTAAAVVKRTCLEQHVVSADAEYLYHFPVGLNDWNCFCLLVEQKQ